MVSIRQRIEKDEERTLAAGAARSARSRGRQTPEPPHPFRTAFMRDRDRILHCKAFRRLAHKTQVFVAPEGDHHRVRLTHTLEVAQIARTISRALKLNEDLTEAICLGHDLGHTPFGHLGEQVLGEFLGRPFRHNVQSLRIVDHLEFRVVDGIPVRGLNLTREVRDGILNHTWSMPPPETLEGGIARFADRIAYLTHDIDDAMRAGILRPADLPSATRKVLGETASSQIDTMVESVVGASQDKPEIRMGKDVFAAMDETRSYLFERVYNRPGVKGEQAALGEALRELLAFFKANPGRVPGIDDGPETGQDADFDTRLVDYIAGMTDRFALRLRDRLRSPQPAG